MLIRAWWIAIPAWAASFPALGAVRVTAVFDGPPGGPLADGESVTVSIRLQAEDEAALFGAELDLATATADVSIRTVELGSAFSAGPADDAEDSADIRRVTGIQPLGAINRSLGADGAPIHFATVELEALTDRPFESAFIVKARGALVGKLPDSTVVFGYSSDDEGWAIGQLRIVNSGAGEQAAEEEVTGPEAGPWTVEQAEVMLGIRPVGGGEAVTTLEPNTEYEVHYHLVPGSPGPLVPSPNGFDLFVTGDAGEGPPLGVGGSESCWDGATVTALEPLGDPRGSEYPASPRIAVSADLLTGNSTPETGNSICSFTTGPAGTLTLDLRLYHTDPQTRTTVEMLATAEYVIEED